MKLSFSILLVVFLSCSLTSCLELLKHAAEINTPAQITDAQIGKGLKEALRKGVKDEVTKLTLENGFYKNEKVKILIPEELTTVVNKLNAIGLNSLTAKGEELLNRAAEDAVKEGIPIFTDAITSMTILDARKIIMGHDSSATQYLHAKTNTPLYTKFHPQVKMSLNKVGAADTWNQIISRYNKIPFVKKINPDLSDHVTTKALDGVFDMITIKEADIRHNFASRTTDLLKQVFALQDKK